MVKIALDPAMYHADLSVAGDEPCLVHVDTDLEFESPKGDGWWDVPVAQVSTLDFTRDARIRYEKFRADQKPYL